VNSVSIDASDELGGFWASIRAGWCGSVPAVMLSDVMTLAVAGSCMWTFPVLRKMYRLLQRKAGNSGRRDAHSRFISMSSNFMTILSFSL
jgi:hypothetical protein